MNWNFCFEHVCSTYACRTIVEVANDPNKIFSNGPSGVWLNEIVAVTFDGAGRVVSRHKNALRRIYRSILESESDDVDEKKPLISLKRSDSYRYSTETSKQNLIKFDLNNNWIEIISLNVIVRKDVRSSILRPTLIVMLCEIFFRAIKFTVLDANMRILCYQPQNDMKHSAICRWITAVLDYGVWLRLNNYECNDRPTLMVRRYPHGATRILWRDAIPFEMENVRNHRLPLNSLLNVRPKANGCVRKEIETLGDFNIYWKRTAREFSGDVSRATNPSTEVTEERGIIRSILLCVTCGKKIRSNIPEYYRSDDKNDTEEEENTSEEEEAKENEETESSSWSPLRPYWQQQEVVDCDGMLRVKRFVRLSD